MSRVKWDGKVPIDDKGCLIVDIRKCPVAHWDHNRSWYGTLRYVKHVHARSSVRIVVESEEGLTYSMFMSDFTRAVTTVGMDGDTLTGKWRFVKKGRLFGVALM